MAEHNKNLHIVARIQEYCAEIDAMTERFGKTQVAFSADFAYRSACAMCVLQIGELAARLTDDFRDRHNGVPWKLIRAMRNVFAHDYDNMNIAQTWTTITTDIPRLKEYCGEILRMEGYGESEDKA
ncbi:MAG: DUF86 domain-containing protein [Acidaminococcales bacterium]|jgi:uncharacterized protein with HEPN domain|nr:DUF86 domain-containing protein [Acidaminococcales bacterium]